MAIPMEHYEEAAAYIRLRMTERPEVCLVLGSGLGRLAEEVHHVSVHHLGSQAAPIGQHQGPVILDA